MKLPSILKKFLPQRKEEKEYFLSLEIKNKEIKAAIWRKEKEKVAFVNLGKASYFGDWNEAIKAADEAIVAASADIPQEEIEKVIFGVSSAWTAENKILNLHLGNLKKLCAQLALKPLGFVVVPESMINYLKQIEGVPPTAILIGMEEAVFTLTLARAGRVEGIKVVEKGKGRTLEEQIEETLGGFSAEILPSRILLYDGEGKLNLEKIRGDLLSYRFSSKLSFLHLPKIEILEEDFDIKAIAMAAGAQLGEVIITEEVLEGKTPEVEEKIAPQFSAEKFEEKEVLGFIKERDILEEEKAEQEKMAPKLEEEREEIKPPEIAEKEHIGFLRGIFKLPSLSALKFPWLKIPRFNFPISGEAKWFVIIFALALIAVVGGLFAAWWYLPKAEIKIWIQTQPLEKEAQIIVSQNLPADGENSEQISGKMAEVEEKASEKTPTTGKKTVGDPAKGKIVIYNKTENEKRFPSGTVIIGPGDLRFTLDKEVIISSTSAFSTSLSSATEQVTAVEVGPEGNLSAGTNFSFKDYPTSSYFAKSEEDFSEGTSREISVVAKSDQEKLLSSLSATLTKKAKEDLVGKLNPEERLIERTITSSVNEKRFNKEVGEETTELELTLSMTFKGITYNEKDVKEKLLKNIQETAPQGYELNEEETRIETLEVETKENESILKVAVKTSLIPELNLEEIRKNIAGKKQSLAEGYLKNLGGVTKVEINIQFPLNLQILPHLPQNIKIETVST